MTGDESPFGVYLDPDYWPLFVHTAVNMHARQVTGIAERKLRHMIVPALPVDFDRAYDDRIPPRVQVDPDPVRSNTSKLRAALSANETRQYRERLAEIGNGELTFLNDTLQIERNGHPEWFHPELSDKPGLWALKFRGFEFLAWPVLGYEPSSVADPGGAVLRKWIRNWDASVETAVGEPEYLRGAWTPHSVSLRLLNGCRYYARCAHAGIDSEFLRLFRRMLYKNALFLEKHVEHDVGGNHLVENGAALVMAGTLFRDASDGQRWRSTGTDVLAEAGSQFLPDGGHFERSPMYHLIVLQRYLTVLDLLLDAVGLDQQASLVDPARRGVKFLQRIRPPDGRIPLLNDAVYGEALELESCLAYARLVGIDPRPPSEPGSMPDTGYYWLGEGSDRLLVDGGPFGPPHLPAHSHNDFLSIMLWVDGTKLLADTGTYEYAPTDRRQMARSVRGHSTIQVGSAEPVDVGGRYLAGRRLEPTVRYWTDEHVSVFDGRYRKRSRHEGYAHRRRIVGSENGWLVRDTVSGCASGDVCSRLQLHPQVSVEEDSGKIDLRVDGRTLVHVLPIGFDRVEITETPYFPGFGEEVPRTTLEGDVSVPDGTSGFLLRKRVPETAPIDGHHEEQPSTDPGLTPVRE